MAVKIHKTKLGEWQYIIEDKEGNILSSGFKSYEDAENHMKSK